MSRIKKWFMVPAVALGLLLYTGAPRAEAGGFAINVGSGGFGYGGFGVGGFGGGGFGVARYSSGFNGYGRNFGPASGFRSFNNVQRGFGPVVSPRYGVGYRGFVQPRPIYRAPVFVPQRGHFYQPGRSSFYRGRH